jgi:hypothetical protein
MHVRSHPFTGFLWSICGPFSERHEAGTLLARRLESGPRPEAKPLRALDPQGRGRQFMAARLVQLAGTRAGGFVLVRQEGAGKWGTATYSLVRTADEA